MSIDGQREGSTCSGKYKPLDPMHDQLFSAVFMDNVVIPPVTQRDPASPTSPKARTVGTEKAGGEKDMTHPQANVSMWLFPTQL